MLLRLKSTCGEEQLQVLSVCVCSQSHKVKQLYNDCNLTTETNAPQASSVSDQAQCIRCMPNDVNNKDSNVRHIRFGCFLYI